MKAYKNTEAMPYERFLKYGAESLTDAELLAIILRTGTKEKNALELAGDILHLQGNMQGKLIGLHQLSLAELKSIPGIGEVKAIKVYGEDFHVNYDSMKRTGVAISKQGASKAVSVGAYAFALSELDRREA